MAADSASNSSSRRVHAAVTACGHHRASSASAHAAGSACRSLGVRGGTGSRVTSRTRAPFSSSATAARARSADCSAPRPRERAASHTPHTRVHTSRRGSGSYIRARRRERLPTAAPIWSSSRRWSVSAQRRTASRAPLYASTSGHWAAYSSRKPRNWAASCCQASASTAASAAKVESVRAVSSQRRNCSSSPGAHRAACRAYPSQVCGSRSVRQRSSWSWRWAAKAAARHRASGAFGRTMSHFLQICAKTSTSG